MVGLLHTPEWGADGGAPAGFSIDSVKYDYVKGNDVYDTVTEGNVRYYQSSKTIDEFALKNGVFDWGTLKSLLGILRLSMIISCFQLIMLMKHLVISKLVELLMKLVVVLEVRLLKLLEILII